MNTALDKNLFWEIQDLMIENEKKLITSASMENKNNPLQVNEVYDKSNEMKTLDKNNPSVKILTGFISDIANSIKLFSAHFTNYAQCPDAVEQESILKEKANNQLEQTKKIYEEYTKNLPNLLKPLADQIYYDIFAATIKPHPVVSMYSTDGSSIKICGNVKKSVLSLVDNIKLKQQETVKSNALSWFVDEMYDYLINSSGLSYNAKQCISQYTTQQIFTDRVRSIPESQLEQGEFGKDTTDISYKIRDKEYTFKDETTFTNFMSTRAKYYDRIMQGIDYTNLSNLTGVGTTDHHVENGTLIVNNNPKISYNYSEDYKTYIGIQAYSASRNMTLTAMYEKDRGYERDGIFKYKS